MPLSLQVSISEASEAQFAPPSSLPANRLFFLVRPSPVHSAHVGQELEVHYRCHPYYGQKVLVRVVQQRATGQFLTVQGPSGIVVSIAGWMLDPVICTEMTMGAPRVHLAALVDLKCLLMGVSDPTKSRIDGEIVREKGNEVRGLGISEQRFGLDKWPACPVHAAAVCGNWVK